MSSQVPLSIIEKLQKLMALRDKPGTEAEAANAALKIQEICTKYNVDIGVVENLDEQEVAEKGLPQTERLQSYDLALAHAVDSVCDVQHFINVYRGRKGFIDRRGCSGIKAVVSKSIVFIGLSANVESAVLVWSYLDKAVEAMLTSRYFKGEVRGVSAHRAYRLGASDRIQQECRKQKREYVEQLRIEGSPCMAVVLVGQSIARQALEDKTRADKFESSRYRPSRDVGDEYDSYKMGHEDGGKIDPHGARTSRLLT